MLKRYGGTVYTGPLVATQKPGITNERQFSSNPPPLGVIRQVVYRGIALGRRGVYGYSINTELRSQGATPRRTPRIGVFHTNVRNQDKDYAGYPQAHRASLRTVALTKYASRDMFLKIFEFFKGLF